MSLLNETNGYIGLLNQEQATFNQVNIGEAYIETLNVSGNSILDGDVEIKGSLLVEGKITNIETINLIINDPLIKLGNNNISNTNNVGFYGQYASTKFCGLIKKSSSDDFYIFSNTTTEPSESNDVSALTKGNLYMNNLSAAGLIAFPCSAPLSVNSGSIRIDPVGISNSLMATDSIGSNQIIDQNITSSKYGLKSINTSAINDYQVQNLQLDSGSVSTIKLQDSCISEIKILPLCITAASLASNCVTTAKILDSNITTSKILDGSIVNSKLSTGCINTNNINSAQITNSLLATGCVGNSNILDFSIGQSKVITQSLSAPVVLVANSINNSCLASGCINTANINSAQITNSLLATDSVGNSNIQNLSITGGKLANNTITQTQMASNSIGGTQIISNTIAGSKIQSSTITGSLIAGSTLTNTHLISRTLQGDRIALQTLYGGGSTGHFVSQSIQTPDLKDGCVSSQKLGNLAVQNANINDVSASKVTSGTFGSGNYIFPNDLQVNGSLNVSGTTTSTSSTIINNSNPYEVLSFGSTSDTVNQGILMQYSTDRYAGLMRQNGTNDIYLLGGYTGAISSMTTHTLSEGSKYANLFTKNITCDSLVVSNTQGGTVFDSKCRIPEIDMLGGEILNNGLINGCNITTINSYLNQAVKDNSDVKFNSLTMGATGVHQINASCISSATTLGNFVDMDVRSIASPTWINGYFGSTGVHQINASCISSASYLDQNVKTTSSPSFVNLTCGSTGFHQTNNSLIALGASYNTNINQPLLTTSSPSFSNVTSGGQSVNSLVTSFNTLQSNYNSTVNQDLRSAASPTFSGLTISTGNIVLSSAGATIDGIDLSGSINQPLLTTSNPSFNNVAVNNIISNGFTGPQGGFDRLYANTGAINSLTFTSMTGSSINTTFITAGTGSFTNLNTSSVISSGSVSCTSMNASNTGSFANGLVVPTGKVLIGTSTIPTGNPNSKLFLTGTDFSASSYPGIQMSSSITKYPTIEIKSDAHNQQYILFDSFWNSSAGRMECSLTGPAFSIYKSTSGLNFQYSTSPSGPNFPANFTNSVQINPAGRFTVSGGLTVSSSSTTLAQTTVTGPLIAATGSFSGILSCQAATFSSTGIFNGGLNINTGPLMASTGSFSSRLSTGQLVCSGTGTISGQLICNRNVDSTSISTGSLVLTGTSGLGVAGTTWLNYLYSGGVVSSGSVVCQLVTDAVGLGSGSLLCMGGQAIQKSLYVGSQGFFNYNNSFVPIDTNSELNIYCPTASPVNALNIYGDSLYSSYSLRSYLNNILQMFDCYYNGTNFISSITGFPISLIKNSSGIIFRAPSASQTQGSSFSWTDLFRIANDGSVTCQSISCLGIDNNNSSITGVSTLTASGLISSVGLNAGNGNITNVNSISSNSSNVNSIVVGGNSSSINTRCKLYVTGSDNSFTAGAWQTFTSSVDNYPMLEFEPIAHNNISLLFDSFYNGTSYIGAVVGYPANILKGSNGISFQSSNAFCATAGNAITFQDNLLISNVGTMTLYSTLQASSLILASFVMQGGLSVQKTVRVGNDAVVTGSTTTGSLAVTTTAGISGVLTVSDTTQSTSTITGAIKTSGGIGVVKDVFIGGSLHLTSGSYPYGLEHYNEHAMTLTLYDTASSFYNWTVNVNLCFIRVGCQCSLTYSSISCTGATIAFTPVTPLYSRTTAIPVDFRPTFQDQFFTVPGMNNSSWQSCVQLKIGTNGIVTFYSGDSTSMSSGGALSPFVTSTNLHIKGSTVTYVIVPSRFF